MARDGACDRRHGAGAPLNALIVIARAPVPGRSKTRLSPPCTPEEAAGLARAALEDTLDVVGATAVERRLLALEGSPGSWLPPGFDVVPQRGDGLGERLAAAFADVGGPAVAVGMDTPQITPALLNHAVALLGEPGVDAVLGPAHDGGYWAIGLRRADPEVFSGVPMSSSDTGAIQLARLRHLGLHTETLPCLRDVDGFDDAQAVAAECPGSRFARSFTKAIATLGTSSGEHGSGHALSLHTMR